MSEALPNTRGVARQDLEWTAGFLLLLMAIVLPWDLFQRLPVAGITLTKLAGAGLIALAALELAWVRRRWPRTGLEKPILLFAAVATATVLWSANRDATLREVGRYVNYLVLFYAILAWIQTPRTVHMLAGAFVASSCGVALLTLACRLGLAVPTLVVTTTRIAGRVTPDKWHELTSRMIAAGDDFNQGVLPMLIAFALNLFLFVRPGAARGVRRAGTVAAMLLAAGILISLSRSSILIVLVLLAIRFAGIVHRGHRRWALTALGAIAVAAVGVLIVVGPQGLADRFLSGIVERDASYEGRWAAFQAGFALLPRYVLMGTGLGASDSVIAASPYAESVHGHTIHSVPFKILLETGLLGFAAFGWLVWSLLRLLMRRARAGLSWWMQMSGAALAVTGVLLAVMAVQPFTGLSLFPFVLALLLGPSWPTTAEAKPQGWPRATAVIAASACAALVVGWNVAAYQRTAWWMEGVAGDLAEGIDAEWAGRWTAANTHYGRALSGDARIEGSPFSARAADVYDVEWVAQRMGLADETGSPTELALLGLGRVAFAQGRFDEAAMRFALVSKVRPRFWQAAYYRAEALWEAGRYKDAIAEYARAQAIRPKTSKDDLPARLEQFARKVAADPAATTGSLSQAATALRRLGRWDEALGLYRRVLRTEPGNEEALRLVAGTNHGKSDREVH